MDGGHYGSLIKITKKCLKVSLKDCNVTKETLHNYLMEIESIVYNHPLTPVTSDSKNIESLTLNHFFISWASPNQTFIAMTGKVTNLCAKWKATQAMVDIFWKKWIKEYLPSLTKRQKLTSYLRNIKKGRRSCN